MRLMVFRGSVLDAPADGLVNAANTELRHGGGVALAIARAAGPELERASREVGYCPLGSAAATPGGRLPHRCVVHVPTIDYRSGGRRATPEELRDGVAAALRLAAERGCRTVALPLLSAGIAGGSAENALQAIRAGVVAAEAEGCTVTEVRVCAFTATEATVAERFLGTDRSAPPA